MNELTIYSRMKEIMNLPIIQEYTELVRLYENKFDTCLLINIGGNNE